MIKNQCKEGECIKILAVGDIMMGVSSLRAIAEKDTIPALLIEDSTSILRKIKPFIEKKDILFGNLECIISNQFDCVDLTNPNLLIAPLEAVSLLKFGRSEKLVQRSRRWLNFDQSPFAQLHRICIRSDIQLE